jgi:DNA-binding transcriptional LysR family regulator
MNSRFLETFIALARTPRLRHVAERLHATPSALSMRIRSLEEELGVQLFAPAAKGLILTDAGRRLQPYAEAVVSAVDQLCKAARPSEAITGTVRVGVIETVVLTVLPDLMKLANAELPGVRLDLSIDLSVNLIEELQKGRLDLILCIAQEPGDPYTITENLITLPSHWVARKGLVARDKVEQDVFRHALLTQMRNTAPYNAAVSVAQSLAAQQRIPATSVRVSGSPSLAALVALVREGLGIGIVPGLFVRDDIERGQLETLALPSPQPAVIAQWHGLSASPAALSTAQIVQRACAAYCARHAAGDWIYLAESRLRMAAGKA